MEHVPWARDLARRLLEEPLPRRWAHTAGVGRKAESVAHLVTDDAETLICAAWLHDIGYSPALAITGFHPLDGARYLRDTEATDLRLCRLVANHSGATVEARNRELEDELTAEFPALDCLTAEVLTYCDMTTDPDGKPVGVADRLAEIALRYGSGEIVSRSIAEAAESITQTVAKIEGLLAVVPRAGGRASTGAGARPNGVPVRNGSNDRQERPRT